MAARKLKQTNQLKPKSTAPERESVINSILHRMADGETLREICRSEGMPAVPTFLRWCDESAELAERYARARRDGLDAIAEQVIELADRCREGVKVERKEVGRQCSVCGAPARWINRQWAHQSNNSALCEGAKAEKVIEEKTTTGDMVERARLQVDARKWLLSKLRPDKYGDRIEVKAEVHTTTAAEVLRARRAQRNAQS